MKLENKFTEFEKIDSTNLFIKRNIKNLPHGYIAFTTNQTNGYGTKGRRWINFKNESLAVSVLLKNVDKQLLKISTQLACVCVLKSLNELNIKNVKIKWFNDIIIKNKKIAGILGEAQIFGNEINLILGLGINLLTSEQKFKKNNLFSSSSILQTTNIKIDHKIFLKHYIKNLNQLINNISKQKLETIKQIKKIYVQNCYTPGCQLKILNNFSKETFFAQAITVLNNGNLLVKTKDQKLKQLTPSSFSAFNF